MSLLRRHFLASLLAAQHQHHQPNDAIPFEPDTLSPNTTRRDIATMKPGDSQLEMFRAAVAEMRRRSQRNKLDPLGWYQNATLHALFCATNDFSLQVHYCWLFLPWHRAYLAFLERKMRAVINEPTLMLPYWDWTRHPHIPAAFSGATNPLNDTTRIQRPADTIPPDFIDVASYLRAPSFRIFGGFPKHTPADMQVEGILEQGAHNNTHNWIGGNMAGFPSAGFDPIFGTHHGNVDRLWQSWLEQNPTHLNPTDAAWLNYTFFFHDERGRMISLPIRDMLRTEQLGYRYDSLSFTPTTSRPAGAAYALLRFERSQVPVHPYCARVFLAEPGHEIAFEPHSPEYTGTFTLLPVADHSSGYLDQWVTMQFEVSAQQAESIRAGSPLAVWLAPVSLRGRQVPLAPLAVRAPRLSLAS